MEVIDPPVLLTRPRLRGVWHKWAFVISVPLGLALVVAATTPRARVALAVYAVSLMSLFGVSAVYHRVKWRTPRARLWMRRLDHSMIFMLIAGTYTPFAVLALHGRLAFAILIGVWALAAVGVCFNLVWITAPKWLLTIVYMAIGWVAAVTVPQLVSALGDGAFALLVFSGLVYTAGAVVYAVKRPDPVPTVFGYHELFHALVVVAAAVQYAVIAVWVAPGW